MLTVRLHNSLVREIDGARLAECNRASGELSLANRMQARAEGCERAVSLEVVRPPEGAPLVRLVDAAGAVCGAVTLEQGPMESSFDAYDAAMKAIAAIDRTAPVRGLESLEYARRVSHDEAALWLRNQLRPLVEMSLHEARVLFTLIFLSCSDRSLSGLLPHGGAARA
jgi:hypothetical protein